MRAVPLFGDFVEGEWKEAHFHRYKPTTRKGMLSTLEGRLLPAFGSRSLDRIAPGEARKWFDARSGTAPGGANKGIELLRQIMNFAIARGYVEKNPTQGIRLNRRPGSTRFLSREEVARLHRALDRRTGQGSRQQADIVRLLLLTGCRRGEILGLRWSGIQADGLVLADSKTGPRRVPLNSQARTIPRQAAADGKLLRVPVAAQPVPPAQPRAFHLEPGSPGSGHRGRAAS